MKRIEKQNILAGAAKRVAGRKKLDGVARGDKAFVSGEPFNLVGLVLAEGHKDMPEGERLIFPRRMNGKTSSEALAMALGVKTDELPESVRLSLERLQSVSEMNDETSQALKDFAATLKALIGRSPGRPAIPRAAKDEPKAEPTSAAAKSGPAA